MKTNITLYKYMSFKGLTAFMKYHSLKLSFGYEANDRFEMLPGVLTPSASAQEREKETRSISKHGFISLTSVKDNPYMWGYYAEQYKGACLELSFEVESEDKKRYRRLDKEQPRYKDLPNIEIVEFEGAYIDKCEYENNRIDKVIKGLRKCTKNIISNKHASWAHEKEYRIMYSTTKGDGKSSELLDMSESNEGVIYSTKDLNRCAVALHIGALCPVHLNDVKLAMQSDSCLRDIRIDRVGFKSCLYSTETDSQMIEYENYIDDEAKRELKQGNIYSNAEIEGNILISLCKYGNHELLMKICNLCGDDEMNKIDVFGDNCLDVAIRRRSKDCAEILMKKSVKPMGLTDEEKELALLWCASVDFDAYMKELLSGDIRINCKDVNERNILMVAARNGSVKCMKLMLANTEDNRAIRSKISSLNIDERDNEGRTALMLACLSKQTEIVKLLIDNGADVNLDDNNKATAIFFAASSTSSNMSRNKFEDEAGAEIIQMLMAKGVDTNHQEKGGYTPLMYAANSRFRKCAERLLSNSATSVDIQSDNGYTAAMYSILRPINDDIDLSLLPHGASLEQYIVENHTDRHVFLSYFLRINPNFDLSLLSDISTRQFVKLFSEPLDTGLNLLMYAAMENRLNALKSMVDVIRDDSVLLRGDLAGITPLMWAVGQTNNGDNVVLPYLCDKLGMKALEQKDFAGCNVLMWAARKGDTFAVDYLLKYIKEHSADSESSTLKYICERDHSGMTAVMWAASKGKSSVIETIYQSLAEFYSVRDYEWKDNIVNDCDFNFNTPLDYAVASRDVQTVGKLLELQAGFHVDSMNRL